jgi:acyl dehydratase
MDLQAEIQNSSLAKLSEGGTLLAHGLMTCAILLFSPAGLTQRDDVATKALQVSFSMRP